MLLREWALINPASEAQPHVLIVHRDYRHRGGEDLFLEKSLIPVLIRLNIKYEILKFEPLKMRGLQWFGQGLEILAMILGLEKLRPSYFHLKKKLRSRSFTHVFFNNFIPTLSLKGPWLAKKFGAQTAMWVHNGRLLCANGLIFNGREICRRCLTHGSRWALYQNCHGNRLQSLIYSWIYRGRRVVRLLDRAIDEYLCVSEYAAAQVRESLKGVEKIPSSIRVVRPVVALPKAVVSSLPKTLEPFRKSLCRLFYLFMGRISYEKGADLFADLAHKYPEKIFFVAGTGPLEHDLRNRQIPNLIFGGFVGDEEKKWLYRHCQALILSSRVPENAPLVIVESEPFSTPVVYPKGGGAEELVRFLGRKGCPIDEFQGQEFSRSHLQESSALGAMASDFCKEMRRILG